MFSNEKKELIKAGMKLDRYGLIALGGGNVSMRMPTGEILMSPSGMIYEELEEDDVVVMDIGGNVLEGARRPSSDSEALLYILREMPDVNAVIHTHQPYATGLGLVMDEFVCNLTTLANAARGSVTVAPYSAPNSLLMGENTVKYLNGRLAVILKHHGVVSVGDSLKQALYACVYLEEAAKTYVAARSISDDVALLTDEQIEHTVEIFRTYGQAKGNIL
ncbi:MAG: class II aldolase/adducin family protein [Clostridiales bacterium]|nr:class II aldolase/adducin family protein [Clostridiales bacterium]